MAASTVRAYALLGFTGAGCFGRVDTPRRVERRLL